MMISCIIAVRDGAAYLGQALDSLATQTRPADEVIVVDDGSTDGSGAIAAAHPATTRVVTLARRGQPGARNVGLEVMTGELVAFLDADDRWHPTKLERQLRHLDQRPELDGCLTALVNFLDPVVAARPDRGGWPAEVIGPDWKGWNLSTMLGRRTLMARLGGFREDRCAAWAATVDWVLRAKAAGARIEQLPELLYERRLHDRNMTRTLSRAAWLDDLFQAMAGRRTLPLPGGVAAIGGASL